MIFLIKISMKNINHEDSAPDLPVGKHQKCLFLPSYLQFLSDYIQQIY